MPFHQNSHCSLLSYHSVDESYNILHLNDMHIHQDHICHSPHLNLTCSPFSHYTVQSHCWNNVSLDPRMEFCLARSWNCLPPMTTFDVWNLMFVLTWDTETTDGGLFSPQYCFVSCCPPCGKDSQVCMYNKEEIHSLHLLLHPSLSHLFLLHFAFLNTVLWVYLPKSEIVSSTGKSVDNLKFSN